MVNSTDFAKRLKKLLEYHELSAANFADKIEVGRSSISHILSGRNKPSLDFIMKTLHAYPDVNLYWLMNGKGDFLQKEEASDSSEKELKSNFKEAKKPKIGTDGLKNKQHIDRSNSTKEIHKVIILYKDGSFDAFEN